MLASLRIPAVMLIALALALGGCVATPGASTTPAASPAFGFAWGGNAGPGMMGRFYNPSPGPGEAGFAAGTPSAPRVVYVFAGPGPRFSPSDVRIVAGETIRFVVTTMGPTVHEFKVGRLDDVNADADAAPEIGDIGMMESKSLTYTFAGSGPFGYACHEPGHFEAGMVGTITIVD